MKAHSIGVEFTVVLSDEEISVLGEKTLMGRVRCRDRDGFIGDLPFFMRLGDTPRDSFYCHVKILPSSSEYGLWKGFIFTISKEGYDQLLRNGDTGDRTGAGGCRLSIYSEEKWQDG